ncbi:MAG: hypothetical protein V3U11_01675, partial [Planctomycetota bacterium]
MAVASTASSSLILCTLLTGTGLLLLPLTSCGGGGPSGGRNEPLKSTLQNVHQGRLADVYGLRNVGGRRSVDLYQTDVLIGPDINDQRPSGAEVADKDILYDFISFNPQNLQPRLVITRAIGSEEFLEAFHKLDDRARDIAPAQFGRDTSVAPYTVVPRNAALRLTFYRDLELTEDFFVARDGNGQVVGLKNTEAVQLLQIKGDPNDNDHFGDFQVIPTRVVVRDNLLILDPVLLGNEGLQFGVQNVASGMPASPDQTGANIRLAVALVGPLRIGGISDNPITNLSGLNNSRDKSIIRDFRSGNVKDNSPHMSRGFIRDPLPLRLVGQIRMFLENAEDSNVSGTKVLTIFKGGINHEIDAGDAFRVILLGGESQSEAIVEVLADPPGDRGRPEVQHVDVLVRDVFVGGRDLLEELDPSNQAGFPKTPGPGRNQWLRANAPRAVLIAEYTHQRSDPNNPGQFYGDNPGHFIRFSPTPVQDVGSTALPNQDVSPFADAIVWFNKPVDMTTVGLDNMFFATRDVTTKKEIESFLQSANMATGLAADPAFLAKFRT